jgi:orotate phosphoribosyltransferase
MSNPIAPNAAADASRVVDPSDPRWASLRTLIDAHSIKRGEFILASGRTSAYLFQLRQTMMLPEGGRLLGDIIVDYMNRETLAYVGGLAVGAIPLVCAVSVMSAIKATPKNAFFVRKEAKEHGARERIDGQVQNGAEVMLVDDVATSGGSILKALDGLREEFPDCHARKALVIVDRQEGATENLAARGIELVSIFKRQDFTI